MRKSVQCNVLVLLESASERTMLLNCVSNARSDSSTQGVGQRGGCFVACGSSA